GDEEGQTADQADAVGPSVGLEALRLAEEEELGKPDLLDLARQISTSSREGGRYALDQIARPLEVVAILVSPLERSEESVVLEPVPVFGAERLKAAPQVGARARAEVRARRFEHAALERDDDLVVDGPRRECPALHIARPQQAVLDQPLGADQELVAGEGRLWLVRGIAIARGPEGQRLPPALSRVAETVDPLECGRPHIADAVPRWQRGDVQQCARGAVAGRKRRKARSLAVVGHGLAPRRPTSESDVDDE